MDFIHSHTTEHRNVLSSSAAWSLVEEYETILGEDYFWRTLSWHGPGSTLRIEWDIFK